MRVAHIADSHFDVTSRFAECVRVHDWIAADCAARGVDLAIHSGDVYERKSNPEERNAVAAWVQRMTASCPLVFVRGNHDALGDLLLLSKLETQHEVIVEEGAGVHVVADAVIACLSWPSKSHVLALAKERAWSHDEGEQVAGAALRAVLLGLANEMDDVQVARGLTSAPRILLSHAMVRGSMVSTGQPLVGCDLELGAEDLRLARASYYALGHIHLGQQWGEPASDVVYPGSPRRTAYGETEQKGYVIANFDDAGKLVSWERIPTPCAPMLLLEGEYSWENWHDRPGFEPFIAFEQGAVDQDVTGAEIRVRYSCETDHRDGARAAAERLRADLLARGAIDVKLDERVIAQGQARAPEVATATTLADKLHALWAARGTTPEPDRADSLLAKAAELEAQESAA